jgi:glycosyltransferase involved in cell wall biosynthesis
LRGAETPGDLAAATRALLADAPRARAVGEAGRRYVAARHDWVSIAGDLEAIYAEVSAGGRHAP